MTELALMTPTQLTRGVALRRYGFGKSLQQIADESGLRVDQVRGVLKGGPVHVAVAAGLTGYLRTPCWRASKFHDRLGDDIMSESRAKLMERFVRMRILARALGKKSLGWSRVEERIASFTDNELRAYCYNAEDAVKEAILGLYPALAKLYKFSDGMAPWEYLERIDELKGSAQSRAAVADFVRAQAPQMARQQDRTAA